MHKILIIEDDKSIQKNLEYLFLDRFPDCEVFLTSTVEESRSILKLRKIDLVISDYNLGEDQNTLELIREIDNSMKVIYLTGYLLRDIVDLSLLKSNLYYMLKPYDNEELINLSSKLLRGSQITEDFNSSFMSDLIEGLSHEILNPLSVVYGFTNKAQDRVPEEVRLEKINSRILEIKQKISLLKSVFQVEYNLKRKDCFNPKIELSDILNNEFEEIDFQIDGMDFSCDLNRRMFKEIFVEVFQNVLDFTPQSESPKISIKVLKSGNFHCVEVEDHCEPISDLDRIFNPYYSTKKSSVYNVGLGLARIKYLLSHIQGEINVLSLPHGNKFTIKFK